tara:strand:+ start:151 stop:429 length:279 start_codon:yes stop_codon:yes gene_type:complete
MKSAYELAMERLEKDSPAVSLTEKQRAELAELDSIYQAKMAEKEIFIEGQLAKAVESGDMEAVASLERQKSADRNNLQADLERKKEAVRSGN